MRGLKEFSLSRSFSVLYLSLHFSALSSIGDNMCIFHLQFGKQTTSEFPCFGVLRCKVIKLQLYLCQNYSFSLCNKSISFHFPYAFSMKGISSAVLRSSENIGSKLSLARTMILSSKVRSKIPY